MDIYPPTISRAQPSAISQLGKDGSGFELRLAFPIKYKKKKAFVITVPLKTAKGVTSAFK